MKEYTSRSLKIIAICYLGFPFFYILSVALLFDVPFNLCVGILLSPFYHILSALAVAAGYGLWEMRRWGWYVFVFTNFLIGYENAVIANFYGEAHHKAFAFLASIVALFVVTYRVAREVRVPYFFPKIRWWESDPRYRLSVPAKLTRLSGETVEGQIMDLSLTGCFVRLRVEVAKDEELSLDFAVFGYALRCKGTVVWCTQSTVTHPKGVGIKFGVLSRQERRYLKVINRKLKKIAALYRRSRYLANQEDFLRQLADIESSRRVADEKTRPSQESGS